MMKNAVDGTLFPVAATAPLWIEHVHLATGLLLAVLALLRLVMVGYEISIARKKNRRLEQSLKAAEARREKDRRNEKPAEEKTKS